MSFFRRNRDDGDNKEPEDEKKAQPSRPFSSSRESGDSPARPTGRTGGSGDDEKKGTPFSRSSMFSRSSDDTEKKDAPEERRARPVGDTSGRTGTGERPAMNRTEPPSRFGIRSTSETQAPSSSRFGNREPERPSSPPSSLRRTSDAESEAPPSRFGTFRRGESEEKKDDAPPSRFGSGLRRDSEEKRDEPSSRFGSGFRRDAEPKKDDAPSPRFGSRPEEKRDESSSRFGSGFRRDAEPKKDDAPSSRFGSRPEERKSPPPSSPPSSRFQRSGSGTEEKKNTPAERTGGFLRRDNDPKKEPDATSGSSRLSLRRSPTEEKKDEPASGGGFASRLGFGRGAGTEEKKQDEGGSRFGLRRPSGGTEEKKEESTGGRFLGRRSPTEEKKDTPSEGNKGGLFRRSTPAEGEKKADAAPSGGGFGSRFGLGRGASTEEKKDAPKPPSGRPVGDRPSSLSSSPAGVARPASTRPGAPSAPAKPSTPAAKPKSNRAAAKPLPSGKARLPRFVQVGPSLDFQLDVVGGVLVFAALILISGMISPGAATGRIDEYLAQLFGIGRVLVPLGMILIGGWLLVSRFGGTMFEIEYFRILGLLLLFIIVMATLQWGFLFSEIVPSYDVLDANSEDLWRAGDGGGIVGHVFYIFLARQLGDYPVVVFFAFWWLLALMLTFKTSPSQVMEQGRNVSHSLQVRREAARARREAQRVDMATLAAATIAPAATQRASVETATGRTTTPEQDQAKAAETPAVPVRQTTETQAAPEVKPSRFGRLLRGDKVEAEKVETPVEGRITSEAAQEERKFRFGLPGRRTAAQTETPPSETPSENAEKPTRSEPVAANGGRLGMFSRRQPVEKESAKPEEKSSEQAAGRRLSVDTTAPESAEKSTDTTPSEVKPEGEKSGTGRLGGMGRLLGRSAPEASEANADKSVESAHKETPTNRFRMGGGLFQRNKEGDKVTETPPENKPDGSKTEASSEAAPTRFLGGFTSRLPGRKPAEEDPKASENVVSARQPIDSAGENKSSSEEVPQRRVTGAVGRLATQQQEVPAVSESKPAETPSETLPASTEEVKPTEPQADPVAEIGNRFADLRARRAAAMQADQPASTTFGRRSPATVDENKEQEKPDPLARTSADFLPPISKEAVEEKSSESVTETSAESTNNQPEIASAETETTLSASSEPTHPEGFRRQSSDPFARRKLENETQQETPARPMGLRRSTEITPPATAPKIETSTDTPVVENSALSAEEVTNLKPAQPRGILVQPTQPEPTPEIAGIESTPVTTEQFDEKINEIFTKPEETSPVVEPAAMAVVEPEQPKQEEKPIETPVEEEEKTPSLSWKLPAYMELLEAGSEQEVNQHYLLEQARIIEDTLSSFGAPGKVVEVNSGPVITQFGVEPDYMERRGGRTRVKVSAIAALEKDIALALAAKTIRIEAPVPGKGFVGIEVPNAEAALVSLRDVMASEEHQKMRQRTPLAIGLGQAVDGTPVSADLTAMPHLLIAGTTGSGKSVCVNAIISCLLLQNSPQELQLIMVDPKRVELTGYNGIPHLISNVVVDLERIVGVLKWVQREMDERYRKLNERSARNIQDYNRRMPESAKMPYLVVIIDELADLMMLAPDETEKLIARLAQMSRATGIHLIISTQRPSVDVVTGLIKANFPARIAFAVASGTDSRVILDGPGADRLLGKGDMLFQSPDASAPVRMQGVYLSDTEIERITRYWKEQGIVVRRGAPAANILKLGEETPRHAPPAISRTERYGSPDARPRNQQNFLKEVDELASQRDDDYMPEGDEDEMYDEAVKIVRQLEKASISLLQRRLRIGYTRAARLIDMMEARGIIGPATDSGSKPRDVFPSSNDEE